MDRLQYLFERDQKHELTAAEETEFLGLVLEAKRREEVMQLVAKYAPTSDFLQDMAPDQAEAIYRQIVQSAKPVHRIHFLRRGWFNPPTLPNLAKAMLGKELRWAKYAAAIIIMFGVGAYLWTTHEKKQTSSAEARSAKEDVAPGGDRAVLTLADGSKIILDSAANGQLANQGGVQVVKLANGQIAYDVSAYAKASADAVWNTMTTPRGGQYQVTLPDGTKVWLNAASSITFPTAFIGKERKVKIDGEVYFEVAKNQQQPFLVDIYGESLVQVLGTSFNVNSYQNENIIRTTLVEGSVKVLRGSHQVILKPSQQATIAIAASSDRRSENSAGIVVANNADIEQTLAWKNGFLNLNDLDVYAVMRQLERWYDIKVEYQRSNYNVIFQGQIVRNTNLSDVIGVLQEMGVNCQLEGKRLTVL